MKKVYLITHKDHGIYIGKCFGKSFWTNIDTAGQKHVECFASYERAEARIVNWHEDIDDYTIIGLETEVEDINDRYVVSIESLMMQPELRPMIGNLGEGTIPG